MYYVASNLKVPLSAGKFSQGKWGATHYAHGYYPDSAFEETPADVKTWTGSDDSHYFISKDGDAAEVECVCVVVNYAGAILVSATCITIANRMP